MCVNAGCRQTDLDTRTWHQPETRGSPLPEARAGHSGTVVASMDADASCAPSLVIFGGHAVNGSLSDVYSLRITSAAAREVAGGGRGGGGGGQGGGGRFVAQWHQLDDGSGGGPSSRGGHCAVNVEEGGEAGGLLVFGGEDQGGACMGDLWLFDVAAVSWRRVSCSGGGPGRRVDSRMVKMGASIVLYGGSLDSRALDDIWLLCPKTWTWTTLSACSSVSPGPRAGYTAAVFGGEMLVLGGGDGHQGLHGVFSLKLAQQSDVEQAAEEGKPARAEWSIVRAGYSHSTRGLTVAREVRNPKHQTLNPKPETRNRFDCLLSTPCPPAV